MKKLVNKTSTQVGVLIFITIILVLSLLYSVTIGTFDIRMSDVYKVIAYETFGMFDSPEYTTGPIHDIVWLVRLPRLLLAVLVGVGLSTSGIVMQAVVKNPLADPYILGVSSGGSLGATMAIMLGVGTFFGKNYIGVSAFLGAFIVSILVIVIANIKGRASSTKLLLSGIAVSMLCSAISSFIIYVSSNLSGMRTITYWLMGSLAAANWSMLSVLSIIISISVVFFISQYRILNLMLLGDDVAITLGKDLHYYRVIYLLVSALIIGFLVYASGMIGFVGLIMPHIVRMIYGSDHKRIIIPSALLGAIFLIWSDVFCRIVLEGYELPIGIIISMIGAPVFIYLMINKKYGFGGAN